MQKRPLQTGAKNIRGKIRWGIFGIFVLLAAALTYDAPAYANRVIDAINFATQVGVPRIPEKLFNLGLDLQGGASLMYQADVSGISPNDRAVAVEGVRDVIERRVNATGVSEPSVRTAKVGDDFRINVELPGITDTNKAIAMIGQTPTLEFKEENTTPPRELTPEEEKELEEYNADAKKRAEEALQRVKAEDFEALAKELSEDDLSKNNGGYMNYLAKATSDPILYDWAKERAEGDISDTLVENREGFNILRRGEERDGELEVTASHILICYLGARNCEQEVFTKEEAFAKAQELFGQANADNFADLAREHSTDPRSRDQGGDLGSFPRGFSIKEFEEAVFSAKVGEIIGPVETAFGYHIIYKRAEGPAKEYEVWRILIKTRSVTDILPPLDPWQATGLSGSQLDRAEVVSDPQTGAVQVSLQFDEEGTRLFREITERNLQKPVAIFLDGSPISIPTVQTVIPNGRAVITGSFDLVEARLLSQRLNAGALPVPVELVSQQSIGASLGAESLQKSLTAGIIGFLLVMVFMILYYRLPGVLSVIALILYTALTLAVFKLIGVTLTLAGIAGFILSIGMAVDANVLIFERLKEELKEGKSLKAAVEEGFLRAWTSIRDGNLSTLISCFLLIWLGSSFVQGFAVTLTVGILVSMFTAITVTRVMLRFVVPWFSRGGNRLFLGNQAETPSQSQQ